MTPPPDVAPPAVPYFLEQQQRLSRSCLWQLQRTFFEQQGPEAWRQGTVPHYVTSNPCMAQAYARVVIGFLRDALAVTSQSRTDDFAPLDPSQPLYIVELGAGSGRFAYHFLKKLLTPAHRSLLHALKITYVMTDFAAQNLAAWRAHASLQPWVEEGVLDFAHYDVQDNQPLTLCHSGVVLTAGTVANPLIVLANYVFDSIPQDAFTIYHGELYEGLINVSCPTSPAEPTDPALLAHLTLDYDWRPAAVAYYDDPEDNRILQGYQQRLDKTTVLFPCVALDGLRHFLHLSGGRLLLLSTDKGSIREEALQHEAPPQLTVHGSFSLSVNYHALAQYVRAQGGQVLYPTDRQASLGTYAFVLGAHPQAYAETRLAYEEAIAQGGPDDFYALKSAVEMHYASFTLPQLLAYLRLSGWDAHLFFACFPAMLPQVANASEDSKQELAEAITQIWDTYYPLGEARDLAASLAQLLCAMGAYAEALVFLQRSVQQYGLQAHTAYSMGLSHYHLQQPEVALHYLDQAITCDPTFAAAAALRARIQAGDPPLEADTSEAEAEPRTPSQQNARDLERELAWFARVVATRLALYLGQETDVQEVFALAPPDLSSSHSPYANFLHDYRPTFAERLAVVLSLVPHVRPQLLDAFHTKNARYDRKFTEFGGVRQGPDGDFFPTGETLAFLLGTGTLAWRFAVQALFDREHMFARHNIMRLSPGNAGETLMQSPLRLSEEHLSLFTTGQPYRPDFGPGFPARHIVTQLDWDDLVLHPDTRLHIAEIEAWIRHGATLLHNWGMAARLRPGCRSLFYGPPGTGKTMAACLLGKSTGREVYKVDLALVMSKDIGETEKNLAKVFGLAEHKEWILFFDEADALFGKRSATKDAHDRYANQEIALLLQRLETFDGVVILASNQRDRLDEAFTRRFESVIYFPLPRPEERLRLWQKGIPATASLADDLDLPALAQQYPLAGGAIMNVVRYASLQALERHSTVLTLQDVLHGIRREYTKEGKPG